MFRQSRVTNAVAVSNMTRSSGNDESFHGELPNNEPKHYSDIPMLRFLNRGGHCDATARCTSDMGSLGTMKNICEFKGEISIRTTVGTRPMGSYISLKKSKIKRHCNSCASGHSLAANFVDDTSYTRK